MANPKTSLELTPRGRVLTWLAALAAGAAWLGGDPNARVAAAMLATPLLVDFVCKPRRLHRTQLAVAPRRTTAGAAFVERITVTHAGARPLRECLVVEARTMRAEAPALLPPLPPHEPVPVQLRERSLQRSHLHERVFHLLSQWPLGLFRARSTIAVAADLVTEPARVPLRTDVLRDLADDAVAAHERSSTPGQEFHCLREHQPDDDARNVHALRSAALGTLVRRVTYGSTPRTVGIVLDLRRPPNQGAERSTRHFEFGLSTAATLLHHVRAHGVEARVLVLGATTLDRPVRGPADEVRVLALLAAANPAPHHPVEAEAFAELRELRRCYWIPAGGHREAGELAWLRDRAIVLGGEAP